MLDLKSVHNKGKTRKKGKNTLQKPFSDIDVAEKSCKISKINIQSKKRKSKNDTPSSKKAKLSEADVPHDDSNFISQSTECKSENEVSRKKTKSKRNAKSLAVNADEDCQSTMHADVSSCHLNSSSFETTTNLKLKSSLKHELADRDKRKKKKMTPKKVKFKIDNDEGENAVDSVDTCPSDGKRRKHSKKRKKGKVQPRKITFKVAENKETVNESLQDGNSRKDKAILYLERWKNDAQNWKFEKLTQVWLLKNMFDVTNIPEKTFEILLEYLINLRGSGKDFVMKRCEDITKAKKENSASDDDRFKISYERARAVLQCIRR